VPKAALVCAPDPVFGAGATLGPTQAAFPIQKRLITSAQFGRVFSNPSRSSDRYFSVLARASDAATARLGLTMSKRAAKRAVDRNKLKRLARESFRQQRQLPPWDFVVMAKPGAATADKLALRSSLDGHFKRIGNRVNTRHG
jgi:ribonuclease P protein component